MHQTSDTCADVCACDRMHQMEKMANEVGNIFFFTINSLLSVSVSCLSHNMKHFHIKIKAYTEVLPHKFATFLVVYMEKVIATP